MLKLYFVISSGVKDATGAKQVKNLMLIVEFLEKLSGLDNGG